MSFFATILIFTLALLQTLLQLTPGTFLLFYHASLGKHSIKKTNDLSLFFILGAEAFAVAMWLVIYAAIFSSFYYQPDFTDGIISWVASSIFLALSLASLLFYFRKGSATALFIPRRAAQTLAERAELANSRSDAFLLGFFTGGLELIFSLPIYIISAVEVMKIDTIPRAFIILPYIIVTISPLFGIRALYHSGHNLATIERLRAKYKPILRLSLCLCYFLAAILIIEIGVLANG